MPNRSDVSQRHGPLSPYKPLGPEPFAPHDMRIGAKIIDALDECPNFHGKPAAREKVLDLIEDLVGLDLPNVHLCVASRPEIDIRMVLDSLTTLKISLHDEIGQKEDIIKYIESVVRSDRSMRRWKEEDKQLVVNSLSGKAGGMYACATSS